MRDQLLLMFLEELGWFQRVDTRNVVKCRGGDVVRLPFADERVVFKKILHLRGIKAGLGVEKFLRFTPIHQNLSIDPGHVRPPGTKEWSRAYSEISSNSSSRPRFWLAAVANSSPAQSMGPVFV